MVESGHKGGRDLLFCFEETIHGAGAGCLRVRTIYQAEQKGENRRNSPRSELGRAQHEEHQGRGTGAETRGAGRRRGGRCVLVQILGPALSRARHAVSGSVALFLAALWGHQRCNKCLNHCRKLCKKQAGRRPRAAKIIQGEIMRTRTK